MKAELTAEDLWARMEPRARELCRQVAERAEARGEAAYLVGGSVRDLWLGAGQIDLDLAVEGDAVELARELDGVVRAPSQFMTARVDLPDGRHLDLATARQETYPEPTKLPVVEPATISDDLRRRDFSINAIAWRLTTEGPGELVDPCGGRADLGARTIRILHDRSFVDDPTRIIRAARFSTRLGFALSRATASLVGVAAREGLLGRVTGARVRDEVIKLLGEPSPAAVVEWLAEFGVEQQVFPGLRLCREARAWLAWAPVAVAALGVGARARPPERTWPYLLGALAAWGDAEAVARRLDLDGEAAAVALAMGQGAQQSLPPEVVCHGPIPDVRLEEALCGVAPAKLVAYWLRCGAEGRRRLEREVWVLRLQDADLDGHEVQARGVAKGPAIGVALRAARRAKLERQAGSPEQVEAALAAVDEWRRPSGRRRRRLRHTG